MCYTCLTTPRRSSLTQVGRCPRRTSFRLVTEDGEIVTDGPGFLETPVRATIRGYWWPQS